MCVFRSREYITLFQYLAESIVLYGELTEDIDIIVLTQSDFKDDILRVSEGLPNVTTKIHEADTLFESGRARLMIFDHDLSAYSKILYLDTDILVNEPLKPLFNIDLDPTKLYALEEGVISHKYYGGETLFDLTQIDGNTTAFSTGILLFKNSPEMKQLFSEINSRIDLDIYEKKMPIPECLEQPYVNYCAIIKEQYNNQALKTLVQNNPIGITQGVPVYHFPGGPGFYWRKLIVMESFRDLMKAKS
jgi:lipopolysaccharide biosynthesis glycosyltransferase